MRHRATRTAIINQPAFFPWFGEWRKLARVDVAVCLDSVRYQKAGFLTRARICGPDARPSWLTVPTARTSRHGAIAEVVPLPVEQWRARLRSKLWHAYRTAGFRDDAIELFNQATADPLHRAVDLAERSLSVAADYLGFALPPRVRSTAIGSPAAGTNLLVDLLMAVEADRYVYGPGSQRGQHYLDLDLLRSRSITPVRIQYPDASSDCPAPTRFSILHDIAHLGRDAGEVIGDPCV